MFSLQAPEFFRRAIFFRSGTQNFFAEDFFLVQKRRFFSASIFETATYDVFDGSLLFEWDVFHRGAMFDGSRAASAHGEMPAKGFPRRGATLENQFESFHSADMANTFTSLHYHVIFSTKNREPWISHELEHRVWSFFSEASPGKIK